MDDDGRSGSLNARQKRSRVLKLSRKPIGESYGVLAWLSLMIDAAARLRTKSRSSLSNGTSFGIVF
jgi:hypothetical protein